MLAIKLSFDLKEIVCGNCGVVHAIPETMHATCLKEGGYWFCPNGHQRGYRKGTDQTEADKLRKQLEDEQRRLAAALARANEAAAARTKAEAALKRHKTRTSKGVCPCCNRSFVALSRHIATKHPEYAP